MKKTKIRIMGSFMIMICLCLPSIFLMIQDQHDFHQINSIDDRTIQKIFQKYPLISNLYQYYYSSKQSEYKEYIIKNKNTYQQSEQKEIKKIQTSYNQEIQKLIDANILSYSLLEVEKGPYQTKIGTFNIETKEKNLRYHLNQIYRLNSENDKTIELIMDEQTHKIISLSVTQKTIKDRNQKDMKQLLWSMIKYLGLDDLDDWIYNQNGYESYQAKLRVTYQKQIWEEMQQLKIEVNLLYSSSSALLIIQ